MTNEKFLDFVQDVRDIAVYLNWDNEPGKKLAQEIIDEIHKGKYGSKEGIWPQFEKAMIWAHVDKNGDGA